MLAFVSREEKLPKALRRCEPNQTAVTSRLEGVGGSESLAEDTSASLSAAILFACLFFALFFCLFFSFVFIHFLF